MAKIKFGMMMTDARGKLGGQVFSKNRSGSFVRTKVTPSNPRTASQMASRSWLGSLSAGWNALTNIQRASWNGAVEAWQKTNVFGDTVKPSGKNLYTALNKNLLQSGQDVVLSAPEKVDLPIIFTDAVLINSTTDIIDLDFSAVPAGVVLQVSATPPLNAGVSFVKGKQRVIAYLASGEYDKEDLFASYVAKFGDLSAGNNVHFVLRFIGPNGQASVPKSIKAVVS